jgi:ParB family chromosome partitioning protein
VSDSEAPPRNFRRRGLGRGLEALLAGAPRDERGDSLLIEVDPQAVAPNPEQPRRDFDKPGLNALAESMRLHGLLHPIIVQRDGEGYRLVAGERRLRAAEMAGLATIPAIVRPAAESGRQALEMALTENLMRTDLNPIEEAAAYARLVDAFGLSQQAIALRLGRSNPVISNTIRLLLLPAPVQEAVAQGRLSAGHGRAILALPDPREQEAFASAVEAAGLSVRETERAVHRRKDAEVRRATAGDTTSAGLPVAIAPDDEAIRRGLEQAIGLPVLLERLRRGGGRVTIHFAADEDLDALYTRLGGAPL